MQRQEGGLGVNHEGVVVIGVVVHCRGEPIGYPEKAQPLTTTAADCGERLEGQCESVELRRCVTHRVRAKLRVAVPASLRAYERGTQSNPTTNCAPLEAKGHDAISVVRRRDNFGWQRGWPFCWPRRQINDCLTIDPLLCLGTTVK